MGCPTSTFHFHPVSSFLDVFECMKKIRSCFSYLLFRLFPLVSLLPECTYPIGHSSILSPRLFPSFVFFESILTTDELVMIMFTTLSPYLYLAWDKRNRTFVWPPVSPYVSFSSVDRVVGLGLAPPLHCRMNCSEISESSFCIRSALNCWDQRSSVSFFFSLDLADAEYSTSFHHEPPRDQESPLLSALNTDPTVSSFLFSVTPGYLFWLGYIVLYAHFPTCPWIFYSCLPSTSCYHVDIWSHSTFSQVEHFL